MQTNKKEKNQQIQVFVRLRPANKNEHGNNTIEVKSSKELCVKHHGTLKNYNFDGVFGPDSKQVNIYKLVAAPTVDEVIAGYNCTIFAYGQTGTGKTYTMAGPNIDTQDPKTPWFEDTQAGIIPRTLTHMFDELRLRQLEYSVRVSYLELYNEEIFDLLSPIDDNSKLKLYDDIMKKGSVIVQNLTEIAVNSKVEIYKILERGSLKRRTATTLVNAQSSRSHTVFCITVHTKENILDGEDLLKTGKLYLVDLAGSENIKQSGASEMRAREAANINQSLLTLGRCIVKLIERSPHIPYRESKLTRLLQDSLGGRTKTTLIATISPSHSNVDESLNTLDYANRAKSITNKPEVNQRLSKKTLLKEYTQEIERLRKDLLANKTGKGIILDEENYESLIRERDAHKDEIADKIALIKILQEQMDDKQKICDELKISLLEHKREVEEKSKAINTLTNQLEEATKEIDDLQLENDLKQYIVLKHTETEEILKSTARELISVADITTSDTKKLHDKLETLVELNHQNKLFCEQHITDFLKKTQILNAKIDSFSQHEEQFHSILKQRFESVENTLSSFKNRADDIKFELQSQIEFVNSYQEAEINNTEKINTSLNEQALDSLSHVENQKNNSFKVFNEKLVPNIEVLFQIIYSQQNLVKNTINNLNDTFSSNVDNATNFENSCLELINSIKSSTHALIKEQCSMNQRLQCELVKIANMNRDFLVSFRNKHNKMKKLMNDVDLLTQVYYDNVGTVIDATTEVVEIKTQDIIKYENNIEERTNSVQKLVNTYTSEFLSSTDVSTDTLTEMEDFMREYQIEEAKQTTAESITECLNDIGDNFKRCWEKVEEDKSHISTSLKIYCEENLNKLESIKKSLHGTKDIVDDQTKNTLELMKLSLTNMKEAIDNNKKYCLELESTVSTELDKCCEKFKILCANTLRDYKKTGETPQRQQYKYPRNLVETKPHNLLREEFQKTKENIPIISESVQEDVLSDLHENIDSNIPQTQSDASRKDKKQS